MVFVIVFQMSEIRHQITRRKGTKKLALVQIKITKQKIFAFFP